MQLPRACFGHDEQAPRMSRDNAFHGTRDAVAGGMRMTWNFRRAGAIATAVSVIALAGCASSRYERTTGEFVDDKMLGNRVKHALNAQPVYKYPDVKVQTYRGVVQLSGFVATDAQRGAATEIARQARGVTRVENNILLAPLEQTRVRDYIPGRAETNGAAHAASERDAASGSAGAASGTSSGGVTPAR
jgi:hypothetical protein